MAGALPLLYGPLAPYPGALEQLFPTLELLCDDKVWSVRQACARVMGDLAELCTRAAAAQPPANAPTSSSGGGGVANTQQQVERLERRADEFQARLVRNCYLELLLPSKSQWVVTAARQQAGALVAALRPGLGGRGGGGADAGAGGAGGVGGAGGGGAGGAGEGLLGALVEAYCAAASSVGQGAAEVRRACAERFADVVAAVSGWATRGSAGSG